jgi:tungstate transport system ATP-binding protein
MITHDIAQAKRLAQHIVFVNQGQVVEHSTADDFFTQPRSIVAQAYIAGKINVNPSSNEQQTRNHYV